MTLGTARGGGDGQLVELGGCGVPNASALAPFRDRLALSDWSS
jgi:hypothetical protein